MARGSSRISKRAGRSGGQTLAITVLLALLVVAWLTTPRWAPLLRGPLPELVLPPATQQLDPGLEPERRIGVKLFMEHPELEGLVEEERSVPVADRLPQQVRVVVEELVRGSQLGFMAPLSPETRVLDVFILEDVAVVNLSAEAVEQHEGGSVGEMLTVYSIVNTITASFPAIARVQITVEGEARVTFAGHLDLSRPLHPDLALVLLDAPAVPEDGLDVPGREEAGQAPSAEEGERE